MVVLNYYLKKKKLVTDKLTHVFSAFQCLVYFKVQLLSRNKSRILRLLFQNVISLDSLRSGRYQLISG